MKSYTDLEQSKKLADILPIESADMFFHFGEDKYADSIRVPLTKEHWKQMMPDINPCWSLAALLELLPYEIVLDEDESLILDIHKEDFQYYINYGNTYNGEVFFETLLYDDFIDACYEMIINLHEQKLL